jgi:hypothetical protein
MIEKRLFHKQVMGDCPRNLRNFHAVRQAGAIEIRLPDTENLGFPLESAEGSAVQNPVPVSFRGVAVILGGNRALRVSTLQEKIVHNHLDSAEALSRMFLQIMYF